MKKLVLLIVVLVSVIPAKADIFSDDFNIGVAGYVIPNNPPDNLNRAPVNWDIWGTPGKSWSMQSNRGDAGLNAIVISQWGADTGITTKLSYDVSGMSSLNISVETMSEGWGWHLTGLVGGIFKDAGGVPLSTVLTSLTDPNVYIEPGWVWVTRNASVAVPTGAASVQFQIVNPYMPGQTNGAIWFDNFVATPEPMTVCLLGLGALLIRRK
jgi:hypothetical protein